MNSVLLERWNLKVSKDDLVIIVGDFSFEQDDLMSERLTLLNGNKLIVLGNHDKMGRCLRCFGQDNVTKDLYIEVPEGERSLTLRFNHFPYIEKSFWRNFLSVFRIYIDCVFSFKFDLRSRIERRVKSLGKRTVPKEEDFYFYGHTHLKNLGNKVNKGVFHIGCDGNNFYPYNLYELLKWKII